MGRRRAAPLSLHALAAAFDNIDETLNVGSSGYSFFQGGLCARIETVAHEVAHWIVLDSPSTKEGVPISDIVERRLLSDVVSRRKADRQEILTCAVEYRVLRRLGVHFELADLANDAADMCRLPEHRDGEVLEGKIRRAMRTRTVKRLERRFIRLVARHR